MIFVFRMAVRETRASWRRLLFFFVCIAVGVAAIVALRSVIQNVRDVFGREAKTLIAADVLISTNRDWTRRSRQTIDRRLEQCAGARTGRKPSKRRPCRAPLMAEQSPAWSSCAPSSRGFRFTERSSFDGGQTYSHTPCCRTTACWSALSCSRRWAIGRRPDGHRTGPLHHPRRDCKRAGTPRRRIQPRTARADRPAPTCRSTGLLAVGSRARRVLLVKRAGGADSSRWCGRCAPTSRTSSSTLARTVPNDDEIGRDFDRAENYLSLVGLVIVILGGIAVSSVTRVFILQKIRSIAVLKCVGARSRQIIDVYLLQVLALGLAGSLLGVLLAACSDRRYSAGRSRRRRRCWPTSQYGVTWSAAAQGIGIGVLVSLLFSVVPLLQVRIVKPSLLSARRIAAAAVSTGPESALMVLVSLALVALDRVAGGVCSASASSSVRGFCGCSRSSCMAAGRLLVRIIAPLGRSPSFPLRHAVLHLSRPGQPDPRHPARGRPRRLLHRRRSVAAGEPARGIRACRCPRTAPDMFLMDIQRDQVEGVRAFLADPAHGAGRSQLIPGAARARDRRRVAARRTSRASRTSARAARSAREYTITYRDHLEPNETDRRRRILDWPSDRGRSVDRAGDCTSGSTSTSATRCGSTSSGRDRQRAGHQHPRGRLARLAQRRLHVRVPARRARRRAADVHRAAERARTSAAARARFQHDLVERFPNVSVDRFPRDPR